MPFGNSIELQLLLRISVNPIFVMERLFFHMRKINPVLDMKKLASTANQILVSLLKPLGFLQLFFFFIIYQVTLHGQPVNNIIGDVVMPAPNAAALGKYTDMPVSYTPLGRPR